MREDSSDEQIQEYESQMHVRAIATQENEIRKIRIGST